MRKKCKNEKVYDVETNFKQKVFKNEHYCNVLLLGINVESLPYKDKN